MAFSKLHSEIKAGRRQIILSLLFSCVMFRALIPLGYMPGNVAAGQGLLIFCGLDSFADTRKSDLFSSSPDSFDIEQALYDNPHEQLYDAGHANLCVFSPFGQVAVVPTDFLNSSFMLLAREPYSGYDPPFQLTTRRYFQYSSRAPPLLS